MSLKSKFISVITVGAGVVVFSAAGFAQDNKTVTTTATAPEKTERQHGKGKFGGRGDFEGRHHEHGREGGHQGMFRGLNLTEDQKAQIKALRESNRPDAATIAELKSIREARKSGMALTAEQQERLKSFREQGRAKAQAAHAAMLNILTPEQRTQLETQKTEMKQHMQERREQWETRRRSRTAAPAATDKPKDN